jgi:hypothetical protein
MGNKGDNPRKIKQNIKSETVSKYSEFVIAVCQYWGVGYSGKEPKNWCTC